MVLRKFDDEILLDLHRQGLTDAQIAEELGVTQSAVNYRREKLGLKNNYRKHPTKIDPETILDLHSQGLTNSEIARKLHVSLPAIIHHTQRLGIQDNYWKQQNPMGAIP